MKRIHADTQDLCSTIAANGAEELGESCVTSLSRATYQLFVTKLNKFKKACSVMNFLQWNRY